MAPSGSNGNNYQLLKTLRVTANDTLDDTATAIGTAIVSKTTTAIAS